MKKLTALCVLLALTGMLSVGGTLATSETQENTNPFTAFFQTVLDILDSFGKDPASSDSLKIDTLFQFRDAAGTLRDGNDNYLQPVNTAVLSASEQVTINDYDCLFWPRTSGATDKIISVKNTARENVYFRTALLFKCSDEIWNHIKLNRNEQEYSWAEESVTIDGKSYPLLIATYQSTLEGGQISPPLLMQIAVDESAVGRLETFGLDMNTFAIEADAFKDKFDTAEDALDAAIPIENIKNSFN